MCEHHEARGWALLYSNMETVSTISQSSPSGRKWPCQPPPQNGVFIPALNLPSVIPSGMAPFCALARTLSSAGQRCTWDTHGALVTALHFCEHVGFCNIISAFISGEIATAADHFRFFFSYICRWPYPWCVRRKKSFRVESCLRLRSFAASCAG